MQGAFARRLPAWRQDGGSANAPRRFVACFVASGSSHAMRSDNRGSKMTAGERWSMWCRSKKLLLLKTDQTPLVSARSCVSALASQASSFHVRFAPDSNGNADIAEGQSWANKRLMHCSNYRPSRSPRRRGRAASPAFHAKCLRGLEIDDQLDSRGLLDRQVSRLLAVTRLT